MLFPLPERKRILLVTGHYGSGKTEFSVSLAMHLARENTTGFSRIALCDLDIVNPYFRSRERAKALGDAGIRVYGGIYGSGTTAEIPELSADVRAPLEDADCFTIVDVGGNEAGARVLTQFGKYFTPESTYTLAVVNANRPDTATVHLALEQIGAIEAELGFPVDALVNNTHLLTETDADCVKRGAELCSALCGETGKRFFCSAYPEKFVSPAALPDMGELLPLGMYMRQNWLDK